MNDRFVLALLDPRQPVPDGLNDGAAHPPGNRFDVYRNNVVHSLVAAVRTGFPVVTRLIGRGNMDRLAGRFVRAHPPSDPLMMYYGAHFPGFLATARQVAHLPYLPDIARLELAIRRSYHARDADPITPEHLSQIPTRTLMRATLTFAPAVRLVRSDWPIHDIWRADTGHQSLKPAPEARPEAQEVLITRPEFDPRPQVLPPGGAHWVEHLMAGASIETALDAALRETPQFDMAAPLTLLLLGGALLSLVERERP